MEVGVGLRVPVLALADPDRLDRALGNLLANAAAAGTRFGIDAALDRGCARLHFYDDGPGISPEVRARLFQPFVSRWPGGTGLGLAIVAQIAADHGGRIDLTDRSGWATCFNPVGAGAGVTESPPAGRFLPVDDEAAFQRHGSAWLRSLGHEVLLVGDAISALDLSALSMPC